MKNILASIYCICSFFCLLLDCSEHSGPLRKKSKIQLLSESPITEDTRLPIELEKIIWRLFIHPIHLEDSAIIPSFPAVPLDFSEFTIKHVNSLRRLGQLTKIWHDQSNTILNEFSNYLMIEFKKSPFNCLFRHIYFAPFRPEHLVDLRTKKLDLLALPLIPETDFIQNQRRSNQWKPRYYFMWSFHCEASEYEEEDDIVGCNCLEASIDKIDFMDISVLVSFVATAYHDHYIRTSTRPHLNWLLVQVGLTGFREFSWRDIALKSYVMDILHHLHPIISTNDNHTK